MTEGSVPTPIYIKVLSVHDLTECEVPCFSGNMSQKKKMPVCRKNVAFYQDQPRFKWDQT